MEMELTTSEIKQLESVAEKTAGEVIRTNGDGLWTDRVKATKIDRIKVHDVPARGELEGETFLFVYLDTDTWHPDLDGLVYTDKGWLKDFRELMRKNGFAKANHINYTEQGMQGYDYVHLIVGVW